MICLRSCNASFMRVIPSVIAKDKRRLLLWLVLWPAKWLRTRGVSVTDDKYREIFTNVMVLALQMGNTGGITYRPAWLFQSFAHTNDTSIA